MPNCPYCLVILGIFDGGFICPCCTQTYSPNEGKWLEGYDREIVFNALAIFEMLLKFGFVVKGRDKIIYVDGKQIMDYLSHKR